MTVTYGFAHQATSAVLTPDVPSAIEAKAKRAFIGRLDSIISRKGDKDSERLNEANENILSRRNAALRGPV